MNDLDRYLSRHFLNAEKLATSCGISPDDLARLIKAELVPEPAYIVSGSSIISSHVFGSLEANGSTDGHYFHPATAMWVDRAKGAVAEFGLANAPAACKTRFQENLQAALADFDQSLWRLRDAFTDEHREIATGLQARTDAIWEHFLKGTFGLCVANPDSERSIARKEILQEKLTALTENGGKAYFSPTEIPTILAVLQEFAEAAMPFSPVDYPLSSRKRLVEDLRARLP